MAASLHIHSSFTRTKGFGDKGRPAPHFAIAPHKFLDARREPNTAAQAYRDDGQTQFPSSPWPRSSSQNNNNSNTNGNASSDVSKTSSSSMTPTNGSSSGSLSSYSNNNNNTISTSYASAIHRRRSVYPPALSGDDFRHPLDQQNTALLRAIPGLELLARNMMGPVAEQVLLLENISSAVLVGPKQLPSLYALMAQAAEILRMDAPELYVRQNPVPNAYTLAIAGRKPFVVVHSALLELLSPLEVQAVLAHELGHLKCDHGVWLTAANVLALGTVSLLPVISRTVEDNLWRWLRAAELTCDRAALLVAGDPRVVVSSLMKLAGGSPSLAGEFNVDAFLEQARSYDEATSSPLGWYLRNGQTRALSHPLPVLRAREVDRWARSPEFNKLMATSVKVMD